MQFFIRILQRFFKTALYRQKLPQICHKVHILQMFLFLCAIIFTFSKKLMFWILADSCVAFSQGFYPKIPKRFFECKGF
ncbi:hypothetical protein CQA40_09870 [Helicobacter sp. MIT 01-3238]|nr:hypothetical protein CQA40_09870 [Helicobacter sp. MIT 01-3238]